MSERVYQQVEDAIARRLYCVRGSRSSGGLAYWTPIGIELGEIVMLWGDCGNRNDPDDLWRWTPEEWTQFAGEDGQYLYEKTGKWSLSPANDPANDLIRRCHQSPNAAGMLMHEWRTEIATLRAELARVTKQRDEAWEMVERAYREGRAPLAVFVPGPCDDDWNDSDAKLALDAARADVSREG